MLKKLPLYASIVLGLTTSAFSADVAITAPETVGISAQKLADLEQHFQKYVDNGKLAGLTTLVSRKGKIVHFQAYGSQNLETDTPMDKETVFRIYSMTKPITSTALMMLWEEGKFKLDDPVSKYLLSFKNPQVFAGQNEDGSLRTIPASREITILDLMRHTAGLSYGVFSDTPVDRAYRKNGVLAFGDKSTLASMITKLGEQPLLYQPGDAWVYSLSVDVQGRLVEILSGKTLVEFFNEHIFEPLEMDDTAFYAREDEAPRLAEMYALDREKKLVPYKGEFWQDFTEAPSILSGGGGLVSTTEDYWRFSQMIANGGSLNGVRILKPETVAMMTKNQLPKNLNGIAAGAQGLGFGLGFAVVQNPDKIKGPTNVGNYFWGGMANTIFWVDPKEEIIAILMTNVLPSGVYPLRKDMRTKVYDAIAE